MRLFPGLHDQFIQVRTQVGVEIGTGVEGPDPLDRQLHGVVHPLETLGLGVLLHLRAGQTIHDAVAVIAVVVEETVRMGDGDLA